MICLYSCGGERGNWEFPVGLGFLMTNVRAPFRVARHPDQFKGADIVGFSSNAWGLREAQDMCAKLAPGVVSVLGGQGALWPGLDDGGPYSYVVRGDGELALQAIVDGRPPGRVFSMRIQDLDTLNPPDRGACASGCVPITTSRGCPFRCAFCSSHAQWGAPRFHSVGWIMTDIAGCIRRYAGIREFYILDDLWAYPPARFEAFKDAWLAAGYHRKYRLHGFIRSNMASKGLFEDMKRMGFSHIRFGAEYATDRMLRLVSKGETVADHQRAIDLAHEVGLPITASFMRGVPGELPEDLAETKAFIKRNRLKVAGDYVFKPFPGCPLYRGENPLTFDMRERPALPAPFIWERCLSALGRLGRRVLREVGAKE